MILYQWFCVRANGYWCFAMHISNLREIFTGELSPKNYLAVMRAHGRFTSDTRLSVKTGDVSRPMRRCQE